MRLVFVAAYVANLILSGVLLWHQPISMSARDGAGGVSSIWHSGALPIVFLVAVYTLLLIAVLRAPRLLRQCPDRWMGIPNPGFWLQAANREGAIRKIQARLLQYGAALFLALLLAGILVVHVEREPPLPAGEWQPASQVGAITQLPPEVKQPAWEPWALRGLAVLFLVYSMYWYFAFLNDFRVPASVANRD